MTARDAAFDEWIERARQVTCRAELERRGLWRAKMLGDAGNPCPGCGGRDRFAVNLRKNLFFCRQSDAGGDAIALARHIDGTTFLQAVETVSGEPAPSGESFENDAQRQARIARLEERARAQAEAARRQADVGEKYRTWEREAAFRIWLAGRPIGGTMAEAYLTLRGLTAPAEARLRFHPALPYHALSREHEAPVLFAGPALLGAIQAASGHFIGVHRTWLDLDGADGKRLIHDPETGEILPSKKVRGSKRGGTIRLAGHPADVKAPRTAAGFAMGEGIETTLSAYVAMAEDRLGWEFHAGVDLGNIAGKAEGRVPHPSATKIDARGRERRVFVPDAVPDPADDTPLIGVPDGATEMLLLGDGDSEPFATGLAMRRAGARFAAAYPGLTVRLAMARHGLDFNGMLREAA